jgi:uncharacterized protein (TIGR03435 family)
MPRPDGVLGIGRSLLLSAAGLAAVVTPIFVEIADAPPIRAKSAPAKDPRYEVASIKLNKTWLPGTKTGLWYLPGGGLKVTGLTTRWLIEIACDVPIWKDYVSGGPKWLDEDRYDIEAKAEPGIIRDDMPDTALKETQHQMLRALLADRFKLELGEEKKEVPVYVLTVEKGGPKLAKAAERDCAAENSLCHHVSGGRTQGLSGYTVNMSDLADILSVFTDRSVQDETGITGSFDIKITGWSDSLRSSGSGAADGREESPDPSVVPDLFTVLREQLGLKLEARKRTVKTFVVNNIERPSGN